MSTRKILVVDDSKSARYSLRLLLQKHDYEVDTAESAENALEKIQADPPHAIFMDHLMPGMNGFEALEVLKGDPRTAHIPVVMCTSNDDEPYQRQARDKGALDILPKPAPSDKLKAILQTVEEIIARQVGAPAPAAPKVTATPPPARETRPVAPLAAPALPERNEMLAWIREETRALLDVELRRALAEPLEKRIGELRAQLTDEVGAQLGQRLEAGWQRIQSERSAPDAGLAALEPRLQQLEQRLGRQDAEPAQAAVVAKLGQELPGLVRAQVEHLEGRILDQMERRLDERAGQLAQELPQNAVVVRRIAELAETAAQRKATQVALAKAQELAGASNGNNNNKAQEAANAALEKTQAALKRMYLLAGAAAAVGILAALGVFLLVRMG